MPLFKQKLAQPICDFIPYPPEDLKPYLHWGCGGIIKRPMSNSDRAGKDRTGLLGSIAHRDHVVKGLPDKFVEILRSIVSDIYADLTQGRYRHRIEASRMGPGTFRLEVVTRNEAE